MTEIDYLDDDEVCPNCDELLDDCVCADDLDDVEDEDADED